jgi:hypothetical protein
LGSREKNLAARSTIRYLIAKMLSFVAALAGAAFVAFALILGFRLVAHALLFAVGYGLQAWAATDVNVAAFLAAHPASSHVHTMLNLGRHDEQARVVRHMWTPMAPAPFTTAAAAAAAGSFRARGVPGPGVPPMGSARQPDRKLAYAVPLSQSQFSQHAQAQPAQPAQPMPGMPQTPVRPPVIVKETAGRMSAAGGTGAGTPLRATRDRGRDRFGYGVRVAIKEEAAGPAGGGGTKE